MSHRRALHHRSRQRLESGEWADAKRCACGGHSSHPKKNKRHHGTAAKLAYRAERRKRLEADGVRFATGEDMRGI